MTDLAHATRTSPSGAVYAQHLAELEAAWAGLPDKPEETPESTLRALWLTAAGAPSSAERAAHVELPALGAGARAELTALVARRLQGAPLAHLTGRQSFMGLELLAGPQALVPRRETELLGHAALDLLRGTVAQRAHATVFDLCTGSGNLALALAHHEPRCTVIGGDLSADAVELAERNAEHTGLTERVRFLRGDLFVPFQEAGLEGAADMIVCNPPYISTGKTASMPTEIAAFEPRLAFDGGTFGISILFRLVSAAPNFLKPRSWLCFEVGAGQGEPMTARLERAGAFAEVRGVRDGAGVLRVLLAQVGDAA